MNPIVERCLAQLRAKMQKPIPEAKSSVDAPSVLVAMAQRAEAGQSHMMVLTIALELGGMTEDEMMREIESVATATIGQD